MQNVSCIAQVSVLLCIGLRFWIEWSVRDELQESRAVKPVVSSSLGLDGTIF
jgi:hypothetical protein